MIDPFREARRRLRQAQSVTAAPVRRATSYRGAQSSRLTEDWIFASIKAADAEVQSDIVMLRRRARDLARSTPHIARFTDLLVNNVIGANGIRLQSVPLEPGAGLGSDAIDERAARIIEDGWREWCEAKNCDAAGRLPFPEMEGLTLSTEATDGEGLFRMLPGFNNRWGFACQLLDADQLDENFNVVPRSGNMIRMSVELDEWGRAVAFHVFSSHPFDHMDTRRRDRKRIPADQILHRYQIRRPSQTRGVTWYAPILMDVQMLQSLQEAELVASRIAAMKGGFFEYEDAEAVLDPDSPAGAAPEFTWEMEPAVWETLPPGLKANFVDPQHPNSAFDPFNRIILRTIAAGVGTSYASLTGDLSDVNFSSIRFGALQERDHWRRLQVRQRSGVNKPVFEKWLLWALTMNALKGLRVSDYQRLKRHVWQPRGWDWVDPLKELKAYELAIAIGIDSRTRIAAERGHDFADTMRVRRREERIADEMGVELRGVSAAGTGGADGFGTASSRLAEALALADDDVLQMAFEQLNGRRSRIAELLSEV